MSLSKPLIIASMASIFLIGVAVAQWSGPDKTASTSGSFTSNKGLESRIRQLESSVEETLKIQGQLLELVNELSGRLLPEQEGAKTRNASHLVPEQPTVTNAPQNRRHEIDNHETRFDRMRENQLRRLTDAGISPERAAFILDKQERIQYEQMQLSYEYRYLKDKSSSEARALQEKIHTYSNPRRVFEQELNTDEFEQYLNAQGGRSELQIGDLLESTPAYEAGLRPGDKIIRYNNQRIFHMGDLRSQVYQVEPGKSVAVEIQRQGSSNSEVIYLPSGPLGIRG
ncbi:PDZ domain-containing protein [Microbulbifer aggregans]|uniref:PDZ domain-containing protein n=1 Tax=Microbulbifer aggregans TaxID=1769779 RepID=UPI001CFE735B|nr:PDZ domain-containing protein [Microbulbifer aggregans]